ncbi:sialidase family protein [Streptomyces zagrosensis]|uniref:exo-alpha-sialidase n=1 Tax=Streptomyces zagrosensis TaxID=1042984 RepID=A0A7W9QCD6_9ACTN|nr:sialidase family protein [Streptomyces zagrosensis]MBB5937329.1 sialidase-1 [Streptomyces zagrosensis]
MVLALLPTPVRAVGPDRAASTTADATADATAGTTTGTTTDTAVAPPAFEQQVLFKASQDGGYSCFRIPAIVETRNKTLLAFAEGRVGNCGDAGDIDLVLKRSFDGGRTWSQLKVIDHGDGDTHGNPAPIVDRQTGRVLLATTYNKGRDDAQNCEVPCDRRPHLQHSDDDGATWSVPRDLSTDIRDPDWDAWYATGPVHGIQLTHGKHAGRLVFGINAESYGADRITDNHAALVLSDDGGDSWRVGALDSWPLAQNGTFRQKPSEVTLVEREDGAIYVNGREQDGTDLGHRDAAVSQDGGESFQAPFQALPSLYTPMVQGSVIRLRGAGTGERGPGRLLLSAPADPDRRRTMMIRSSYDEGRSWESVDRGKVVTTDWSGYSDMVRTFDGSVGLLYEGGTADARDEIRFARFTEDWLGPRRGPDPTTADGGRQARPAAVLGGARTGEGRFGQAMQFDGADDAVRLPFRGALPLGERDFTVSLWFRYSATSGEQPFLWMGGVGNRSPQVAVRGEPDNGRITASMLTLSGAAPPVTTTVHAARAYNDDRWHHLALRRGGGELALFVDGVPISVAAAAGSVSRNAVFGVHVGQKVDSRSHLRGALDEVLVLDRALPDADIQRLRRTSAEDIARGGSVLWLPLDQVRP